MFLFICLGSEPSAPKWKEKRRHGFRRCFVWLAGHSAPFTSGREGWGGPALWRPPPPRRTSNGPVRFPQTSFRGGNWPWLPRAETESSALKQFLCLVTMRRGISTNPLRCQGFRSSTWEKRAWDLPPPPPCVIPWLLDDGAWRPSISLPYFSSWR